MWALEHFVKTHGLFAHYYILFLITFCAASHFGISVVTLYSRTLQQTEVSSNNDYQGDNCLIQFEWVDPMRVEHALRGPLSEGDLQLS